MTRYVALAAGLALSVSATAMADLVSYDHMTGQPGVAGGSSWSIPSGGGTAASTGNRFMGVPVSLAGGATTITGFDTTMVNNTGAAISFQAGWQVRLDYWVYNTWNHTATTGNAFSNLAGNGSVAFNTGAFSLPANSFIFFTNLASPGAGIVPPAATLPGVAITPLTVAPTAGSGPNNTSIGIVLNWKINRNDGAGFVLLGGLSQVIVGGAFAVPPAVGTNDFGGTTLGYYRSAGAEATGNFLTTSARNIGANSGLMLRVYTTPTPGSLALLGLGGLVAARRRR